MTLWLDVEGEEDFDGLATTGGVMISFESGTCRFTTGDDGVRGISVGGGGGGVWGIGTGSLITGN